MILKYSNIMDKVNVTPQMRERILNNIDNILSQRKKHTMYKTFASAAAFIIIAAAALSIFKYNFKTDISTPPPLLYSPNITEYSSLEELSSAAEFNVKSVTNIPFNVSQVKYLYSNYGMAQIDYIGADNKLTFRMCPGKNDISGNYNTFNSVKTVDNITIKGNDNLYTIALWESDGYSYSIDMTNGVTQDTLIDIVNSVN